MEIEGNPTVRLKVDSISWYIHYFVPWPWSNLCSVEFYLCILLLCAAGSPCMRFCVLWVVDSGGGKVCSEQLMLFHRVGLVDTNPLMYCLDFVYSYYFTFLCWSFRVSPGIASGGPF